MTSPILYTSTQGRIRPQPFDAAVLQGFAPDGGLFVPDRLPRFGSSNLEQMKRMKFTDLAVYILSRFIDPGMIASKDLARLVNDSFAGFSHKDILPLVPDPKDPDTLIMELFHGPTLSFKDVAMGFLVRTMDYLLTRQGRRLNLILATTGDTGPAAAHAAANLKAIHCWPLFPKGMITPEQEGQMTGIKAANIHPVGVENCPDGGDDLDRVVLDLFRDKDLRSRLKLSSVNSINWCRVMVQSIRYFPFLQVPLAICSQVTWHGRWACRSQVLSVRSMPTKPCTMPLPTGCSSHDTSLPPAPRPLTLCCLTISGAFSILLQAGTLRKQING